MIGNYARKTGDDRAFKTFLPVVGLETRGWPFDRLRFLEKCHQTKLRTRATTPADPEPSPNGWA